MLQPIAHPDTGLAGTPACLVLILHCVPSAVLPETAGFCITLGFDASIKMFLPLPDESWQPVWLQQDLRQWILQSSHLLLPPQSQACAQE